MKQLPAWWLNYGIDKAGSGRTNQAPPPRCKKLHFLCSARLLFASFARIVTLSQLFSLLPLSSFCARCLPFLRGFIYEHDDQRPPS